MSINMNARCDSPRCQTIQLFSLESPEETGQGILDALRMGGWGVEGTFTQQPKSVRLKCPHCMQKAHNEQKA
jgi:hypothetical protein